MSILNFQSGVPTQKPHSTTSLLMMNNVSMALAAKVSNAGVFARKGQQRPSLLDINEEAGS